MGILFRLSQLMGRGRGEHTGAREKTQEEQKLLEELDETLDRLNAITDYFNLLTDYDAMDAVIYEMKALTVKYSQLLRKAKCMGLRAERLSSYRRSPFS